MAPVNPIPEGYHSVTPYLIVDGANRLIDFVIRAFGAEEIERPSITARSKRAPARSWSRQISFMGTGTEG